MAYIRAFSALLCLLSLPVHARPVPLSRPAPGKIINVRNAHIHDYLSPDGKYVVRISPQYGEGGEEVPSLTVLDLSSARHTRHVSDQWATVTNLVWLPCHPHTLAVALNSDGDFTSALLLWRGPKQTHTLRQGKGTADDDFSIEGVSADGLTLTYKRFGYDAPVPTGRSKAALHRLILPH